jgi:hypothetical protein
MMTAKHLRKRYLKSVLPLPHWWTFLKSKVLKALRNPRYTNTAVSNAGASYESC